MIYYVDYDKENIQAISYYQKLVDKPKVISQATGSGVPRIPAFYDKILYWTSHLERSKSSKWTIEGINTTSQEKLISIPLSGVDDIGDMMLKAPQLGWSRCLGFDECSDGLCVTSPRFEGGENHFECVCQSHYKPKNNNNEHARCQPPRQFMLFSQVGSISRMSFDEEKKEFGHDQILSIEDVNEPISVSWDEKNRRIYWLEAETLKIWSSDESGQNKSQLNGGVDISARDFDIYHPSNLIYWTSKINNTIQFARLTGDGRGQMLGSVGLKVSTIVPDQISIGSKTGQIIFTNSCDRLSQDCELIYKTKMDGTELCSILRGTPRISSLALYEDRSHRVTVYWNDAGKMRRKEIPSDCPEAKSLGDVIKESPAASITVTGMKSPPKQKFYWIETTSDGNSLTDLMSLYVSQPSSSSRLLLKLERLRAVHAVENIQSHAECDNLDCSHICQIETNSDPHCTCPMGNQLLDGYKCQPISTCEHNEFLCDGKCADKIIQCDGMQDCDDGSDEHGCSRCEPNEFKCVNPSRCIPAYQRCDGKSDCPDGSDEYCPATCPESNMLQCYDRRKCYYQRQHCDNHPDCADGSDEKNCSPRFPNPLRVITLSILSAALIVFCVLLAFCYFNKRQDQSPVQRLDIRLDIRPTVYSEIPSLANSQNHEVTHPPAPPPTVTGVARSNRSTTTTTSYRHHRQREPLLIRDQPSGCSEPPSYDNLTSGSSSNGYDYRPRQRHCPTPVASDKE